MITSPYLGQAHWLKNTFVGELIEMYYIWIFLSLLVSAWLTCFSFPSPFGEFPLFGDVTTLVFIPAYFVLYSVILNVLMWMLKNRRLKVIVLLLVLMLLGVSSVLLLRQNYSQFTSFFLTFTGLIFGFAHFSLSEVLRRRRQKINRISISFLQKD
ncbi:hypothetical protein SAMN04488577_3838 [Bacillus sp. cl95]|nr:hypothetical protein SAMN02799634_10822 [Bacillus sp. UNCCL13]SFQ90722.1 hypothetical protein SAMN04488577_3838 [Bacillus sp. cl95]